MIENTNEINKEAWDTYQEDYFKFQLMARPDYFEFFSHGGVDWQGEEHMIDMIGDVKGLKLLDTCCACDAVQAFSWHNMGAIVTACDITPSAIKIASANAKKMKLSVDFIVADMQKLEPINDNSHDIVFATYPCYLQNINEACLNWYRVLKNGGKLLLNMSHPITDCININGNELKIKRDYNKSEINKHEVFDGTGLSDRFGGWSVDLPYVLNFYRISDILNAMCNAGFIIKNVHESYNLVSDDVEDETKNNIQLKNLPTEFSVLAIK
jgi:Methylase involved in ubiquinone/menaquinone biosynthesis